MTATTAPSPAARPPAATLGTPRGVLLTLATLEARRMLTSPLLLAGLAFSVLFGTSLSAPDWSGARYMGMPPSFGPLLLAVSLLSAAAAARDRLPLSEEAPVGAGTRALARLLAGVPLVVLVGALGLAGGLWLRLAGGLDLGDEPGRTLHAHYTLPELLQPAALAVFAVALGAAVSRLLRSRMATAVALFIVWFAVSATYWVFNGPSLMAFSVVQVQPLTVPVGPPGTDPATFPASWLLSAPGEFQDHWGRVVVSPAMAAWHDVYLVGLALVLAAAVLQGRWRRVAGAVGLLLVVAGLVAQKLVQP